MLISATSWSSTLFGFVAINSAVQQQWFMKIINLFKNLFILKCPVVYNVLAKYVQEQQLSLQS